MVSAFRDIKNAKMRFIINFVLLIVLSNGLKQRDDSNDKLSPLYQHLPNCVKGDFVRIVKKTKKKAAVCPMIRDEEGFLSEWVAYYQMHGFDHVFLYNDNSIDKGLTELQPWIDSGFVTVRSNFTALNLNLRHDFSKNAFKLAMTTKALLETDCKLEALKMGYDYQMSLDLDEWVMPRLPGVTIVDELDRFMQVTKRSSYCISKLNFQSTPHILEPINLLTMEAFQTRMKPNSKMNYYTSVAEKCAYKLRSPDYRNETSDYIARCCHFHGCQKWDFSYNSDVCNRKHNEEGWKVSGRGQGWADILIINHYSRSLEKFMLKTKTWTTSSGEVKAGETANQAAASYDIGKFFARSVGFHHDNTALRYSCQLRETLANMTGEKIYLRPGSHWYRNPEFGKTISDPDKRGRYGRANPPGFKYMDQNPYNYHGGVHGDPQVDHSEAEKKKLLDAESLALAIQANITKHSKEAAGGGAGSKSVL